MPPPGHQTLQGNGCDRFAFECTELAHHVAEKMIARLTALKTMSESGMEPTELVDKILDIIGSQLKWRQLIQITRGMASR
jgi:hypothetical protein